MNTQPTLIVETLRAFLILLTTFGVAINAEQQGALILFAGAMVALVSAALAFYNRSKVYAPASVQKVADRAAATGVADIGVPPDGWKPTTEG